MWQIQNQIHTMFLIPKTYTINQDVFGVQSLPLALLSSCSFTQNTTYKALDAVLNHEKKPFL